MNKNVDHPSHYNSGNIEVIDYIDDKLSDEAKYGFYMGNVIKYISRAQHKENMLQDLEKADWYLDRYIQMIRSEEE